MVEDDIEADLVEVLEEATNEDQDLVADHLVEVLEGIQDKEHIEIKDTKHQSASIGVFVLLNLANHHQNSIVYRIFIFSFTNDHETILNNEIPYYRRISLFHPFNGIDVCLISR